MKAVSAAEAKALIATLVLGRSAPAQVIGDVSLHPHQREAVKRITSLLERHRGVLLADDVGLGKTFVALAVAGEAIRGDDSDLVVIAPAALRDAWLGAGRRTRVRLTFVSVEMLGRAGPPPLRPAFVIVDEAHHLRSSHTKRFAAASMLCRNSTVLLLSATPVQNTVDDLRTVLSLFLGAAAWGMTLEQLTELVVRRVAADVEAPCLSLPAVNRPEWLSPTDEADCLDRILALPRAVPPRDGDDEGVLLSYTLVRQWASSRAALRAGLRRRLARAQAIEDALTSGRIPTRSELNAWTFAEGAQQLAFPEIAAAHELPEAAQLLQQIGVHLDGVRELLAWLTPLPDPDQQRAQLLRGLLARHPGERVVAFSEYADTVGALYRLLVGTTRVAMLTHAGGRIAGGTVGRAEILERFAPGASSRTTQRERIDLLLTTDVLSEGVNLQDASVVVHLDLTWNPARLEQRVGRLRRIHAAREAVSVYMFAPPVPAERMLRIEERLRVKLGAAARSIGVAGAIIPGLDVRGADGAVPREERIAARVRSWSTDVDNPIEPVVAAVRARFNGALACVRIDGAISLVALSGERLATSKSQVERTLDAILDGAVPLDPAEAERARAAIEGWLRHRSICDVVDLPALRVARSRRTLLQRVDIIARRAPRHRQQDLAPLMHAARSAATATLSVGAERVLDELARCEMSDVAWLHAIGEFAALHAGNRRERRAELRVLLILKRDERCSTRPEPAAAPRS